MDNCNKPFAGSERGGALMLSLIVVSVVASLGISILLVTSSRYNLVNVKSDKEIAEVTAISGVNEMVDKMNTYPAVGSPTPMLPLTAPGGTTTETYNSSPGTTNLLPISTYEGSMNTSSQGGSGSYTIESNPTFDGTIQPYTVLSTGIYDGKKVIVETVLSRISQEVFNYGAFSNETFNIPSNMMVDSYNSTTGTYASQVTNSLGSISYANDEGHVGSNDDGVVASNTNIFGNFNPGPGDTVTADSTANISGETTPLVEEKEFPDVVVPVAVSSLPGVNKTVTGGPPQSIPAGMYHYSSLELRTGSNFTIIGPADIYIDDFLTRSNSTITFDTSAGEINIYASGDFVMNSNTAVNNTTKNPADLRIWALGSDTSGHTVTVASNNEIEAVVYAPNVTVGLASNTVLYGAVMAKNIDVGSNISLHYDEALKDLGGYVLERYKQKSFRIMD